MGGEIFISYRRGDSGGYARALCDALSARFGGHQIFMDIDSIELGSNFVARIEVALADCKALVAVIGDDWVESCDSHGRRRLDDADDYVRIEIEAALERNIPVIPVLLGGASMPLPSMLTESLRPLCQRNAVTMPAEHFHAGVERLVRALASHVTLLDESATTSQPPAQQGTARFNKNVWIGLVCVLCAVVAGLAIYEFSEWRTQARTVLAVDGDDLIIKHGPSRTVVTIHASRTAAGVVQGSYKYVRPEKGGDADVTFAGTVKCLEEFKNKKVVTLAGPETGGEGKWAVFELDVREIPNAMRVRRNLSSTKAEAACERHSETFPGKISSGHIEVK